MPDLRTIEIETGNIKYNDIANKDVKIMLPTSQCQVILQTKNILILSDIVVR